MFVCWQVLQWTLTSKDAFLVIASDGLWEFMSSEQVLRIIEQHPTPYDAVKAVIDKAAKLWALHDSARDDITCIVVQITPLVTPRRESDANTEKIAPLHQIRPGAMPCRINCMVPCHAMS